MRLHAIALLLVFCAAAAPASAAPVARASTSKPTRLGKVTVKGGRAVLAPLSVPSDRRQGVTPIEIAPDGIPELASPEAKGVFVGKLKRGRKARVSVSDPVDKGVGLVALQGATVVPIYMGLFEPGIHFGKDDGHGGVSVADNGAAALVFGAGVMDGDQIAVTCTGDFPSQVEVRVLHLSSTAFDGVEHQLDGSSGELAFDIATAGMTDGIMLAMLRSSNGKARLEKCVLQRLAPQS